MVDPKTGKRETIVLAAQKLFARFGPHKTTVEEIVRLAKTAKGTFYKYFSDKETLFLEVVEKENRSLVTAIRTAVSSEESSKKKMKAYLLAKAIKIQELANLYQVTRETVDEFWPLISDVREKYFLEEQRIIKEILTGGVLEKEIEVNSVELTSYAIVMAVKGLEMSWMLESSPMKLEEGTDLLLDILFRGIQTR